MSETTHDSRTLRAFAPALGLLFVCLVINYVDRGNLSIAAPLLKRELDLSPSQLGILFAAFFATYTAMQFVIGWLVDRFEANTILAAGFLLWSLATTTTGLVRGFAILLTMRLILGIGESVALPASSKILCRHLPEHHRGFASGALMSALRCGNAVGTFGAGYLMAKYGWRPVFIWVGLVSILWLPAWWKWKPRNGRAASHSEQTHSRVANNLANYDSECSDAASPGVVDILRQRSFWGTSIGHFSCNYLFYFMITWLPSYLVLERHLSLATMTTIAGLYYSVDAASAIAGGWLQDFAIRRGHSATLVRKSAMAIGFGVAAVAIIFCAIAGPKTYTLWLMAAGVGCGLTGPGLFTFPQTLAGPKAVGKWYGSQNGFANTAGVVGPALTGFVVQRTGNFLLPFVLVSALCVVGALAFVFVVKRVEPVRWAEKRHPALATAGV
jgi:ACS family D-galactonate transporter-like MFS transporter